MIPTCPKRELRIGRKFKSDWTEDAALDLPERREDLLEDAGTGEDDAVDGGHTSPLDVEFGRVCSRGARGESKKNAASSEPCVKDWVLLGIRGECEYLCRCSDGKSSRAPL